MQLLIKEHQEKPPHAKLEASEKRTIWRWNSERQGTNSSQGFKKCQCSSSARKGLCRLTGLEDRVAREIARIVSLVKSLAAKTVRLMEMFFRVSFEG